MRRTSLTGDWAALAAAYGGVSGLALQLGVHTSTLGRWARGESAVSRPVAMALAGLARAKRLRSPAA